MSLGSYNIVLVGTTPTLILASNPERKGMFMVNNGQATIYIGPDTNITTGTGIPILSGGNVNNSGLEEGFRGSIYGITALGTVDVRFWEWIQ